MQTFTQVTSQRLQRRGGEGCAVWCVVVTLHIAAADGNRKANSAGKAG